MSEAPLLVTIDAGIARVTLSRPEVRNAFDEALRGVTADRRASTEGKEGLAAFLDKRSPDWTSQ